MIYAKKKDERHLNTIQQSNVYGLNSVSNVIHGSILSSVFIAQISVIDWMLSRLLSSYIGVLYTLVHIAWLISWNAFEFKMIHEGMDMFQRVYYFERRWMYFLGYGLPLSVIYTFLFSHTWKLGVCVWYFGMLFMSIRAILCEPDKMKFELSDEEKERTNPLPKRPGARPRDTPIETRLKIFWLSKYITNKLLEKFMEWTKYKPLRKVL